MTAIDDIKRNIQHDKNVIDGKRKEKEKLDSDIRYYEGHLDGLSTAMNILLNNEVIK